MKCTSSSWTPWTWNESAASPSRPKASGCIYKAKDGNNYRLNLIDTPGHVDFSYEVSRALSACEGALLVVDASQGVEAQTVANTFLAAGHNLTIIPVINKIDLPAAQPDFVKEQIENVLAIPADDSLLISAKSGIGVEEVLEAIVERVPAPKGSAENPLQALIFDSWFDPYRGAVVLVRVIEGAHLAAHEDPAVRGEMKRTKWSSSGRSHRSPSCWRNWKRATSVS